MQRYIEVDCTDKDAVLTEFDKILNDIAANQKELDNTLYNARYGQVKLLFDEVSALAGQLGALFPPQSGDEAGRLQAMGLFNNDIWDNLAEKLKTLVDKWKDSADKDNDKFIKNLSELETSLKVTPALPKEAEFKKAAAGKGLMSAFESYCQSIRRLIVNSFDRMDEGFKEIFDELRSEAKECFDADDGGKLANLQFPQDESSSAQESTGQLQSWWTSLANEIALLGDNPADKEVANRISVSIHRFADATLSFRGFLLPRILPSLDVLDTNSPASKPFSYKSGAEVPELIDILDSAAQKGIHTACEAIRSYAKEPSMSLFATIDELRDAITRTGGATKSQFIWGLFYAEHRSEVWQDTFQKKEADIKFRKEWQNAVDMLVDTLKQTINL
jgi:hypothetical protein